MGVTDLNGVDAAAANKILRLLEALRRSEAGGAVYHQVEQMLGDMLDSRRTAEHAYATLIDQLLEACLAQLPAAEPLAVQLRLLQVRLQPPLTEADLRILDDCAGHIEALKPALQPALFRIAVEPLLAAFGLGKAEPSGESVETAGVAARTPAETGPAGPEASEGELPREAAEVAEEEVAAGAEPPSAVAADEAGAEEEEGVAATGESDSGADSAYRSHLDSRRRDIQKLQTNLAQQVLATIAQNEEFGVLLEVVLAELRHATDARELEDLRWTLIREIEKLTRGHHDLAEKLDSTHHYLQLIESDSRRLSDELTRVRLLSLTDELTGLPNRRAFLRRIEDEVARVQRYGFPLSLALIDLDHFKQINDKYGHGGGDEVLKVYSKNILSIFRHHDLVARYGGEEFAVLLPNTDAEGAMRALTKVKNRAGETYWQANGGMVPVPTFSAGVSLYKPGETATAFIERADKALYQAKRLGRNRVEIDATYQGETATETAAEGEEGRQRGQS